MNKKQRKTWKPREKKALSMGEAVDKILTKSKIQELPPPATTEYSVPVKKNDLFVFMTEDGQRIAMTGEQLMKLVGVKAENERLEKALQQFANKSPIPSIPVDNEVKIQASEGRIETTEEIVDRFMKSIAGRENIFPAILDQLSDRIISKLSHDTELHHERAHAAKCLFDDAIGILAKKLKK